MSVRKVTLAREDNNGVEYVYPKTTSDIVEHQIKNTDEYTSVKNKLDEFENKVELTETVFNEVKNARTAKSDGIIKDKLKTRIDADYDALNNKIDTKYEDACRKIDNDIGSITIDNLIRNYIVPIEHGGTSANNKNDALYNLTYNIYDNSITSMHNLNNYTKQGYWHFQNAGQTNTIQNYPASGNSGYLFVIKGGNSGNNTIKQIWISQENTNYVYIRSYGINNTWDTWIKMATEKDIEDAIDNITIDNLIQNYIVPIEHGGTGANNKNDALYNLTYHLSNSNDDLDLDNYLDQGYWYFHSGALPTNHSPVAGVTGYLIVMRGAGSLHKQIWLNQGDTTNYYNIYVRTRGSSTWQPWVKIATDVDVNDLSIRIDAIEEAILDITNSTRKIALVGTDDQHNLGYHLVANGTADEDSNISLMFAVHDFAANDNNKSYKSGILVLDLRRNRLSGTECKKFGWISRSGFDTSDFVIIPTGGADWKLYCNIDSLHVNYRTVFEVIEESSTKTKNANYTLYSNIDGTIAGSIISEDNISTYSPIFSEDLSVPDGRDPDSENGFNSTAIGYMNKSTGRGSASIGYINESSAYCSFAVGEESIASNSHAIALGCGNTSSGQSSFSAGDTNIASGNYSSSIGSDNTSSGINSIANGDNNTASGNYSICLGRNNTSTGINSTSIGYANNCNSDYSVALGYSNTSSGEKAIAIGDSNNTYDRQSTAIGYNNYIHGNNSIGIGSSNSTNYTGSIVIGNHNNTSDGLNTYAYGMYNIVKGSSSMAIGCGSSTTNDCNEISNDASNSMAIGNCNKITGQKSISIGIGDTSNKNEINKEYCINIGRGNRTASLHGDKAIMFGHNCYATDDNSIAIGHNVIVGKNAIGIAPYLSEKSTSAIGENSIVIGSDSVSRGKNSISFGYGNEAASLDSMTIGKDNKIDYSGGNSSFAIGIDNDIKFKSVLFIGYDNKTLTSSSTDNPKGWGAVVGLGNRVNAHSAYIFGDSCKIGDTNSSIKAEASLIIGHSCNSYDRSCTVIGCSCSAGDSTRAAVYDTNGDTSSQMISGFGTAIGFLSDATAHYSTVIGTSCNSNSVGCFKCGFAPKDDINNNIRTTIKSTSTNGDAFVVGNGSLDNVSDDFNLWTFTRSNAFRIANTGAAYANGAYNSTGADYAEFVKEWYDGNPDNEDRVGYMVTIGEDGLLHKANDGDYIIGITSGNPSVIGNGDEEYYWRYERDKFNRIIYEDVEIEETRTDNDGNTTIEKIPVRRKKTSSNYNSDLETSYIERSKRPEWDYVGMRGIVPCRDDGTCTPRGFCKCGNNGIATKAETRGFDTYYVIERIDEETISVEVR